MRLTGRRSVIVDQLRDGTVVIRPTKSILHLAGSVSPRVPRLTIEGERKAIHHAMIARHGANPTQSR